VCGKEAGATKPAPDPYLLAREIWRAAPLVGRGFRGRLESGRAAGFDVLWVPDAAQAAEYVGAALASVTAG